MKTHFFINEKNTIDNNKKYKYNASYNVYENCIKNNSHICIF